ncbi:hypothetical protein KAFR_0F01410 [Kazachstania africana CBS 2517]|uniref:GED domain-containing protein n=1 Tax=Kazachstania africana (strain ATCC 22294 / BCRC 22015 / CBS 2517 / CECT 1963 / NBRC 1671 / NRRL Y-8276) TaxID=1071382 RepID=H2AWI7_KAZAF|nr:hypothetical protein KAFR_0F01410 [Kazachstania africana CBS 2517]CCF58737.1 hypothetical protein KAFR_0F01410 [Kazachstania africana CBS 2517]
MNTTLNTLTAHKLLVEREKMLEVFHLVEENENTASLLDPAKKQATLQAMQEKLNELKKTERQ